MMEIDIDRAYYFETSFIGSYYSVCLFVLLFAFGANLAFATTMEELSRRGVPLPIEGYIVMAFTFLPLLLLIEGRIKGSKTPICLKPEGLQDLRISSNTIPWDQIVSIRRQVSRFRRTSVSIHLVEITKDLRSKMKFIGSAKFAYRKIEKPLHLQTSFVKQDHVKFETVLRAFLAAHGRPDLTLNLKSA